MSPSIALIIEDIKESSPVTLLLLVLAGACGGYVVLSMVYRVVKLVHSVATKLQADVSARLGRAKSHTSGAVVQHEARSSTPTSQTPGKSIKQLLKEKKKAETSSSSAEVQHDSKFYLNSLRGHGGAIVSVATAPDSSHVVTACADEVLRMFDMAGDFASRSPSIAKQVLSHEPVGAMFWGDTRTTAAITTNLGANFVVTRSEKAGSKGKHHTVCETRQIHNQQESIQTAGASTSGGGCPVMVSLTKKKEIKVLVKNGQLLATLEPSGIENYEVVVARNGRFIAAATWGSDVKLWELAWHRDGSFRHCTKAMELKGHRQGILSVAFSPDTKKAVTASRDGTLRIWNIDVRYHMAEDPKCILDSPLQTPSKSPYSRLCWCNNGIIVGAHGHDLHYINSSNGAVVATIAEAHTKRITCLCTTNDAVRCGDAGTGFVVLSSSIDGKVRIWAVPSNVCKS